MGNLLYTLGKDEDRFEDWFAERGDIFDEVFEKELESKEGQEGKELTDKEKFDFLVNKYTGNKKFDSGYNPKEYYGPLKDKQGNTIKESSAEYQNRMQKKGVTAEELAQAQAEGKIGFTRSNTMLINEGRKRLRQASGADKPTRRPGFDGGPVEQVTEEEEEITTTDPRAGAWGVGGTMPYKEDIRTAGVEMDVPLGRRFAIDKAGKYRGTTGMDLSEAMKYATLGGYEQLEPFQEYLGRRRKYLGEDKPRYFDEEGNVIYSETETT
jgi:hypothetical protein